jgi:hypothetical protein
MSAHPGLSAGNTAVITGGHPDYEAAFKEFVAQGGTRQG